MSARNRPDAPLQRADHADLVETQSGKTYMVYLCGKTIAQSWPPCMMGRETAAIQPMVWGTDEIEAAHAGLRGDTVVGGAIRRTCGVSASTPAPVRGRL